MRIEILRLVESLIFDLGHELLLLGCDIAQVIVELTIPPQCQVIPTLIHLLLLIGAISGQVARVEELHLRLLDRHFWLQILVLLVVLAII